MAKEPWECQTGTQLTQGVGAGGAGGVHEALDRCIDHAPPAILVLVIQRYLGYHYIALSLNCFIVVRYDVRHFPHAILELVIQRYLGGLEYSVSR